MKKALLLLSAVCILSSCSDNDRSSINEGIPYNSDHDNCFCGGYQFG